MKTLNLGGNDWRLRLADREEPGSIVFGDASISATVPGNVFTDLYAAGLIDDPYAHDQEDHLRWVSESNWIYELDFDVEEKFLIENRVELVCDGLDTIASLRLNGSELGKAQSMHVTHRFDLKALLLLKSNHLEIEFTSPVHFARQEHARTGALNFSFPETHPHNSIRKAAYQFGWDWGPILPGCGIWRSIRIEAGTKERIEAVRPNVTSISSEHALLDVSVDLSQSVVSGSLAISLQNPSGATIAEVSTCPDIRNEISISVGSPMLWWPLGYGSQWLYQLDIRLLDADGSIVDHHSRRLGIRKTEIITEPDVEGESFAIYINDVPIFVRGYNWIPDDCFPHRVGLDRIQERLDQAIESHANLIRVWGGGVYESDDFYDYCDENGLLVWQDFLFACSAYPEVAPFPQLIEDEARNNINRLASHPSLVVLNGGNENIWNQYWNYYIKEDAPGFGLKYYMDLLPRLCEELLPSVPYLINSPWSGDLEIHPYEADFGCSHQWMRWRGGLLYHERYLEFRPRFVSEFGHQGPPAMSTLLAALPEGDQFVDSPGMKYRERALGENALLERISEPMLELFDDTKNFDRWHYLAQLSQARSVSTGVNYYRSLQPYCMGAIVWQLNDCWPVHSWSAVDGSGIPKLLWYALRTAFAPRCLSVRCESGETAFVFGSNDTELAWEGQLRIQRMNMAGAVLAECSVPFQLEPREARRLSVCPMSVSWPKDRRREFLVIECDQIRVLYFFEPDKMLSFPEAQYSVKVEQLHDVGYQVRITAHTILRDLCLFVDRLDSTARIDCQMINLLPEESAQFLVETQNKLNIEDLCRFPVIQCVNDVVTGQLL